MSTARRCSSLVGRAEMVLPMWHRLQHAWGPARDVRDRQPLMALGAPPAMPDRPGGAPGAGRRARRLPGRGDRHVHRRGRHRPARRRRRARLPAPGGQPDRRRPGLRPLRARPGGLQGRGRVRSRRRSARSRASGCIRSGAATGSGRPGTAAVAAAVVNSGRIASLYVNSFNTVARAAYARVGFRRGRHVRDRPARLSRPCSDNVELVTSWRAIVRINPTFGWRATVRLRRIGVTDS